MNKYYLNFQEEVDLICEINRKTKKFEKID